MMEKVTNFNSEVMYNDSKMSTRNEICKDRTLNVLENLILATHERKNILHFALLSINHQIFLATPGPNFG